MTPDDETLMAYADGELDPVSAKRVERALAADPTLAERVAAHRRLRAAVADAFSPVADEPAPERLRALVPDNVLPFPTRPRAGPARWSQAAAIAASLVVGVALGTQWRSDAPVAVERGALVADAGLARALDRQLAAAPAGDTRLLVSFRDGEGRFCRVFAAPALDGVACRQDDRWALVRTRTASSRQTTEYRQAASGALLAEAQEMMRGDPLDAAAEARARDAGWR